MWTEQQHNTYRNEESDVFLVYFESWSDKFKNSQGLDNIVLINKDQVIHFLKEFPFNVTSCSVWLS